MLGLTPGLRSMAGASLLSMGGWRSVDLHRVAQIGSRQTFATLLSIFTSPLGKQVSIETIIFAIAVTSII